jgi:hypothetical protein
MSTPPSQEYFDQRRRAATASLVEAILEDEHFRRELQENTVEALRRKGLLDELTQVVEAYLRGFPPGTDCPVCY